MYVFRALSPHCNVEIVEKSQSKDVPLYSRVNIPDYGELKAKTRGMDENQRQVVDIAVTFAKDLIKAYTFLALC